MALSSRKKSWLTEGEQLQLWSGAWTGLGLGLRLGLGLTTLWFVIILVSEMPLYPRLLVGLGLALGVSLTLRFKLLPGMLLILGLMLGALLVVGLIRILGLVSLVPMDSKVGLVLMLLGLTMALCAFFIKCLILDLPVIKRSQRINDIQSTIVKPSQQKTLLDFADTAVTSIVTLFPAGVSQKDREGLVITIHDTCQDAIEDGGIWLFRLTFIREITGLLFLVIYYRLEPLFPRRKIVP